MDLAKTQTSGKPDISSLPPLFRTEEDFPSGAVDENPLANAGDTASDP